jgi:hypothetical protein
VSPDGFHDIRNADAIEATFAKEVRGSGQDAFAVLLHLLCAESREALVQPEPVMVVSCRYSSRPAGAVDPVGRVSVDVDQKDMDFGMRGRIAEAFAADFPKPESRVEFR